MIIFAGAGRGGIILPQRPCPGVSGSKDKFVETPPSIGTQGENKSDSGEPPAGLLEDSTLKQSGLCLVLLSPLSSSLCTGDS